MTILGIWLILAIAIVMGLLCGIFWRLGEIRDACEYLAEKTFSQETGTGNKESDDV